MKKVIEVKRVPTPISGHPPCEIRTEKEIPEHCGECPHYLQYQTHVNGIESLHSLSRFLLFLAIGIYVMQRAFEYFKIAM